MATKKQESKKAGPAKAERKANEYALVGFNEATVVECFKRMAASKAEADQAGESKAEAAHRLVVHAHEVGTASRAEGMSDGDELAKAWSANIKRLYPSLAADGVTFIKAEEKADGTIKHTLTGYGQNVNSVCRGFAQYDDIEPDAEGRISEDRNIVQNRRALDLDEETRLLMDAKESLDEALKAVRKASVATGDYSLIEGHAQQLHDLAAEITAQDAAQDSADADAEAIAA